MEQRVQNVVRYISTMMYWIGEVRRASIDLRSYAARNRIMTERPKFTLKVQSHNHIVKNVLNIIE